MRPVLFSLLGYGLPAYFALLVTGFAFATACCALLAKQAGDDPDVFVDLGISMLLVGLVGARILHVLADGFFWDYVHLCTDPAKVVWPFSKSTCLEKGGAWDVAAGLCHPAKTDCFAWARISGGLTYYGGLLAAVPVAFWQLKRDRYDLWKAADFAAVGIALGLAFGRIGCLLAGCCFGAPTSVPWALSFPPHSHASEMQAKEHLLLTPASFSLPVHPTQIYESAACLGISAFCAAWLLSRKRYHGHVFVWFLALYGIVRFALEVFRRDDRGGGLGLSTSQWISLGCLVVAALVHAKRCPARSQRHSTVAGDAQERA